MFVRERKVLGRAMLHVYICVYIWMCIPRHDKEKAYWIILTVVKAQNILFGGEKKMVTFLFI